MNEHACNERFAATFYTPQPRVATTPVHRSLLEKALFWLEGALHKRAGHATDSSTDRLKHIVSEACHCWASIAYISKSEGLGEGEARSQDAHQAFDLRQRTLGNVAAE